MDPTRAARRLAFGQGAFLVAYGIWPIFHRRSFQKMMGSEAEGWLVKTVGALIAVAGTALLVSASSAGGLRPAADPEEGRAAVG